MADHRNLDDKQLVDLAGGADDVAPAGGTEAELPGARGGLTGGVDPIDDPDGDADTTTGNNTGAPGALSR